MPPCRHSRESGNPEARRIPGFRLALAIASLAGMMSELVREFKGHHTSKRQKISAVRHVIWLSYTKLFE